MTLAMKVIGYKKHRWIGAEMRNTRQQTADNRGQMGKAVRATSRGSKLGSHDSGAGVILQNPAPGTQCLRAHWPAPEDKTPSP